MSQEEELARVAHAIQAAILEFKENVGGTPFHCEALRSFVIKKHPQIAPASPDRVLRDMRQRKVLNYRVLSRSASLYEFVAA